MSNTEKRSFWKSPVVSSIRSSLICIFLGLFLGYIVLLMINPAGANEAIGAILKNFMNYPSAIARMKYLGNTLVKTAPLLLCALSVQFCYKVGLFNIGAAGQYEIGACACLYAALAWNLPWYLCLLFATLAGAVFGAIVGALKAMFNVNEVISGIMLNWIGLYTTNTILNHVKEAASPYTLGIAATNPGALLPTMGLNKLFGQNKYVTIAIPLAILIAVLIWVILDKTKFGYELKATGFNKYAAKYAGMKEKKNVIVTLVIGGALAGTGAAFLYLSGFEQWSCTQTSVPGMGFNGIAATFLGGLHPIGTIFSSYFIQHITSGGAYLDKAIYPSQISDLISAVIIYLCGFAFFFKYLGAQNLNKKKTAQKTAVGATKEPAKTEGGTAK